MNSPVLTNRFLALLLSAVFFSNAVMAQMPSGARGNGAAQMNVGNIYGRIVDATTQKAIDGASVQLLQSRFDSISKKKKDILLANLVTTKKGEFNFEGLSVMGSFKLEISYTGYKALEQKLSFANNASGGKMGDMSALLNSAVKDLGNIKLTADEKELQNVTVKASKPLLEMYLDKKVYNVEKDISATGGTAVDVMKNVPSVSVDLDGNVSLRNASPQIFIDGRPSTLSLDQIPADQIASVEIITNPSAKFDASGGGSGILNIVLKKNRKVGYNGSLRTGIDSRYRPSVGGDFNVKQNKINFFASGQLNSRKSKSTVKSDRTDVASTYKATSAQTNAPVMTGYFAFAKAGFDYLMTNRTSLSFSGNMFRGDFNNRDLFNTLKDTISTTYSSSFSGIRGQQSASTMKNNGIVIGMKHNFAREGRELTADINFNESRNSSNADYKSQFFNASGNAITTPSEEKSMSAGKSRNFTYQTDYVSPIGKNKKLEAGLRVAVRNYESQNDNFYKNPSSNLYVPIPAISANYNYEDRVYAAYTTFSEQKKSFSYQLGLRVESSNYLGNLVTQKQQFSTKYPFSLFPSVFLSKKINKTQDIQMNYSRKINRPNFFQILPYVDFSDSLNLSVGNPALLPEFTNLIELSYSYQYKAGSSLLASIYGKNTNDLITRYQYRVANSDPLKKDSLIFNSYANANKSYTIGLELTGKNKVSKIWDITTNLNIFDVTLMAGNISGAVNTSLFSWFAKMSNNFKLPKNYSIQLSGDYQAKSILPVNSGRGSGGGGYGGGMYGQTQNIAQGYIKPIYSADISFKKDFLKNNAASFTLQINDVFRTRTYETYAQTAYFTQNNYRQRDPQVIRLNFNWRFGKFDAALFKRKNMKSDMENVQGM